MSLCCLICYATCCVTCNVTCRWLGLHSFGFGVGYNGFGLQLPFSGFGVVNNGFGLYLHFFLALGLATMVWALSSFFPLPPNSCVFIFFGSPIPLYNFFEVDSYSYVVPSTTPCTRLLHCTTGHYLVPA